MQQDNDVKAAFDEVLIACFLISSVAQVLRMLQNMELGNISQHLDSHGELEGWVRTRIVKNHYFLDVFPNVGSDPFQDLLNGGNGVVGDDQDAYTFSPAISQRAIVLQRCGLKSRRGFVG